LLLRTMAVYAATRVISCTDIASAPKDLSGRYDHATIERI
jgi:hypothetical protein